MLDTIESCCVRANQAFPLGILPTGMGSDGVRSPVMAGGRRFYLSPHVGDRFTGHPPDPMRLEQLMQFLPALDALLAQEPNRYIGCAPAP